MKVDLMVGGGRLDEIQELARRAEAAGIAGLVFTETGRTAYLSVAAAALATERLELSTGIAVAFPRSPMVTAGTAYELADVSKGRFRLGLGTQVKAHIERRYGVAYDHPGPRLKDYVLALRAIFAAFEGAKLDYHGPFYTLTLLNSQWSPGRIEHPDLAIDVAAVGPWMLRMAGEVADGVHVHPLNNRAYLTDTVLPEVAAGAAKAGRDAARVELLVPSFTAVGDTDAEQAQWREAARSQVAFYGSTPNYAFIFDQLGFEGTTARIREKQKAGDLAGMAAQVTDDILDHFAVTATWDQLADKLVERYTGAAHRVVLYFAAQHAKRDPGVLERYGAVAAEVARRTA
ncbi:MAG: TIGR03617 family F420-dependent LLM class oxidoreductase [Acidimicrobiales bacterium]